MDVLVVLIALPALFMFTFAVELSSSTEGQDEILHSMYHLGAAVVAQPSTAGRLQGVSVKGRLLCGTQPLRGVKVKIVDKDPRPDLDDLMGDVITDDEGYFHVSGATRESTDIEVMIKVYHDCLNLKPCQRKVIWNVPKEYYNNGTFSKWFDVGSVNMETHFLGEEIDCRH